MANSTSALNATKVTRQVQAYRNKMLIAKQIAAMKFEELLTDGSAVNFPYVTDLRAQTYTSQTNATIDDFTATSDTLTVDRQQVVTFQIEPVQLKQATAEFEASLSMQSAFRLANFLDQDIINNGITNAGSSLSGYSSLSSTSMLPLFTDAGAQLDRNNAGPGLRFAVIDPERCALVEQNIVANGFETADITLRNGYRGDYNGFRVYKSNNLPSSVTLTLSVNPTAGDTMTIYGVVVTFQDPANSAGECLIGANAAATQSNLRAMMNGTGTGDGTDYFEFATADRRILQNAQLSMGAFAANVSTITGFGKMSGSETFTSASNVFGTETSNLLFGVVGAMSVAMQMSPTLYIRPVQQQIGDNHLLHQLYGRTVFVRDQVRLVKSAFNV